MPKLIPNSFIINDITEHVHAETSFGLTILFISNNVLFLQSMLAVGTVCNNVINYVITTYTYIIIFSPTHSRIELM